MATKAITIREWPKNVKGDLIHLIVCGEYSDYHVVAAYTDKKTAKREAKKYKRYGQRGEVKTIPLNRKIREQGAYQAHIWYDGTLVMDPIWGESHWADYSPHKRVCWMIINGYGKSPEHARRSAEEYRRELVAVGAIDPKAKHENG